jgi:hypothetical protein
MSVIHFSPDELGEIIGCVVGNLASSSGRDAVHRYVDGLAHYSTLNARAYNATYREGVQAWTADQIGASVRCIATREAQRRAVSNAGLLRYNLIANSGEDFADLAVLDTIVGLLASIALKPAKP